MKTGQDYRAVFLDIDDTIFDFEKCSEHALKKAFTVCGICFSQETVAVFRAVDEALWTQQKKGILRIQEVLEKRSREVTGILGVPEKAELFRNLFHQGLTEEICLVEGIREMLEFLYKKYLVYAASNGFLQMQRSRLEKAGLLKYFQALFVSDDIGAEKPSSGFFQECLRRTGLSASEILMVGDSLAADMQGAQKSGLDVCWYNPKEKENILQVPLRGEIRSMKELKSWLEGRNNRPDPDFCDFMHGGTAAKKGAQKCPKEVWKKVVKKS